MMEVFNKVNDIGVLIDCYILANFKDNGEDYIIYSDMTTSGGDFNLCCAKKENDKVVLINKSLEEKYVNEFKQREKEYIKLLEDIK